MTIRNLREDELERAASMLALAFVGDPFPALVVDEPAARLDASQWAFNAFGRSRVKSTSKVWRGRKGT